MSWFIASSLCGAARHSTGEIRRRDAGRGGKRRAIPKELKQKAIVGLELPLRRKM
jgi:hypothetical protein